MSSRRATHHFPPSALADLPRNSASNFMKLLLESSRQRMALVLGAGVSNSAGLPAWPQLLRRICGAFFYHWEFECKTKRTTIEKPPRNLSIAFANQKFWSEESIENADVFASGDPLIVAQLIKNCIRDVDWKWLLRRALFDVDDLVTHDGSPSALIKMLSRLCASRFPAIDAVVSYNYDDLFEMCLKADHVSHAAVFSTPTSGNVGVLPVFHPHGYLPLHGGPANSTFVLAESDYVMNAGAPYSWSNLVQLQTFSKCSCVFIGASMRDTALRRLLRLSRTTHHITHFAFLPISMPAGTRNTMFDALFDKDLRELGVRVVRYGPTDSSTDRHGRLLTLLETWTKASTGASAIWEMDRA